ncbi:MAG: type I-E CRISPR-associated protein Cse2/CasB [Nitrospira sp.]|nr:type I-E CRISPR-associated protein Cse2/CasB [Nitrospira sp.]
MTATTERTDEHFVNDLLTMHRQDRGEDRARLARLKRGFSRREPDYSLLRDLPALPDGVQDIERYLLIASLFALHPGTGNAPGKALKALRDDLSAGAESLDLRFAALLNSTREDLPYRLRQLVQMLKSKEIPLSYHHLLRDLRFWNDPDRTVQRTWARAYYGR